MWGNTANYNESLCVYLPGQQGESGVQRGNGKGEKKERRWTLRDNDVERLKKGEG